MCLFIHTLPKNQRASNCVPCWKWLDRSHYLWFTPYQVARVRDDGVQHVVRPATERRRDYSINSNAIHAKHQRSSLVSAHHRMRAYAFGVMAYGATDLACSLLYIPDVDITPDKTKRVQQIRRWMQRENGPTNAEVKKLFPEFVPPVP